MEDVLYIRFPEAFLSAGGVERVKLLSLKIAGAQLMLPESRQRELFHTLLSHFEVATLRTLNDLDLDP